MTLEANSPMMRSARTAALETQGDPSQTTLYILHLAELVPVVRERFSIADTFADDAILASLRVIANQTQPRERWRAAFGSNLGMALVAEGRDLNTALNTLIALLPRPTS